ncbi:aryl hydrocarbon receptor protein 1 isoform X2 [Tribolium castaneum]|uniref:aryl hydrocarbon receptor protein 1 isoform X2 n=1 Tax=Tribolium castaneum TaxID=7070 RepID=UPI00077DE80E|nr:PREDICTED: aryl hydrocarbon receptor protein 1 isoform X2 [Tribolium castaneum]|eukprot:XP_008198753.2 PREDICTED: aryl hydrocarbon receptor protein 1 isoform X2 [Tribolium castaneum]
MFSSGPRECQLFSRSPPSATTTTEFTVSTATVQGQCVTTLPTPGSAFGGEAALGGGGGGGTTTTTVMNQLGTVYATKRRRRNGKSLKPTPKDGVTKSNPSKRHRERLNAELDTLASLLPFEQNILSKLDRLSILRLSVSYLRTKSYFQVVMHKDKDDGGLHRTRDLTAFDHTPLDGEMFLQALNGFLMILTCEGEVFFATHSIEGYLGFHQSDIVHQSVYELVHSEDREELQRQLMWNSFLPPESANMGLQDVLLPENCHLLERSFTVRFRCLLDNTSGFLRLDIRGRVKVLHGQNRKSDEAPLALFAICTPFGPPSLLEIPQKEVMFKSKHKLDLALVSMDQRGKMLLGYSDSELATMGGYDLVHYDDLAYVASAHQELLKTGASGMIAYRFQTKDGQWQWLQTSSRLVYKNSKPDFVISTHRPLMEEEGRDLLGKRTMDFKVSYLDAGLPNSYFSESDLLSTPTAQQHNLTPSRVNRRYKTQLRDFLSTCRTKRKLSNSGQVTPPTNTTVTASVSSPLPDYIAPDYNMYSTSYPTPTPDLSYMPHSNFYPTTPLDNRYLTTPDNLFHQYRPLGTYYPDYHSTPSYNGFPYEPTPTNYPCQQSYPNSWPYSVSPSSGIIQPVQVMELGKPPKIPKIEAPKMEEREYVGEAPRQTVLMWGSNPPTTSDESSELTNQWNGEEKTEQNEDSHPHHNPHHHHNSRVVMVL